MVKKLPHTQPLEAGIQCDMGTGGQHIQACAPPFEFLQHRQNIILCRDRVKIRIQHIFLHYTDQLFHRHRQAQLLDIIMGSAL